MKLLFVFTEPPVGSAGADDALSRVRRFSQLDGHEVRVFLSGDAARCGAAARAGEYLDVQRILERVTRNGGRVGVCARCMDSRGVEPGDLARGLSPSSFYEFWEWTEWADEVIAC